MKEFILYYSNWDSYIINSILHAKKVAYEIVKKMLYIN